MDALDNRCPACGASIKFNPKEQKWTCEYCGSKFTLEEMKKYNNASNDKNKTSEKRKLDKLDLDVYRCESCGAELMADETTTATFCVYCGNTAILKEKIHKGIAPTQIIPFKNVKEDAVKEFQKLHKGRPLMPKLFNDPKNIEKITGVYIPFWTYDLKLSGDISYNGVDVKTWSSGNYQYTKTDTYLSKRNGQMEFSKILVDASSRFDDDLMDSIEPFKFDGLVEYNHAYLSGFLAEKYDVEVDKAMERATYRAKNTAEGVVSKTVHHQTKNVISNDMETKKLKDDHILLPVWMVNIKYKEKNYTFAMNGQTGKIVGNIPIDVGKAIFMSIFLFIIFTIISYVILRGIL